MGVPSSSNTPARSFYSVTLVAVQQIWSWILWVFVVCVQNCKKKIKKCWFPQTFLEKVQETFACQSMLDVCLLKGTTPSVSQIRSVFVVSAIIPMGTRRTALAAEIWKNSVIARRSKGGRKPLLNFQFSWSYLEEKLRHFNLLQLSKLSNVNMPHSLRDRSPCFNFDLRCIYHNCGHLDCIFFQVYFQK